MKTVEFDGVTYDEARDGARLRSQLERVKAALRDGEWWTLRALAQRCGGSETSISARIRDIRKVKHGSGTIETRRDDRGLWDYRWVR